MFDLDRFVADCRAALATGSAALTIGELLERAVSDPAAVEAALGRPRQGGLFTLHRAPDLTVLNVVWAPGMAISPHEHRMWAVIGLYGGREDNTFYRRNGRGLVVAGTKQIERAQTARLGDSAIHSVVNPLRGFTGAIHVYGGDFFATPPQRVGARHPRGASVRYRARAASVCPGQRATYHGRGMIPVSPGRDR